MRIYSANNVFIEVTRRCNMCCAHCLRGDAESIDIQEKYIDAFLDNFEKGAYISSLTFTGGEISLNIPAIRYTLKAVKERGIAVGSFYSSPQERHDYVVYKMHEDILNQRYHESVQTVLAELKKVIPRIELTGQWSVDVMRNGNDYYIIDMALAENSALNDCVPKNLLRAYPQQWLPGESNS